MALEPWKVMLGLAGLLVVFGVSVSILDTPPVVASIMVVLLAVSSVFGYRLGKRINTTFGD